MGQLNVMLGDLSAMIDQVGGQMRETIREVEKSSSQLIAELDATFGDRLDTVLRDLDAKELRAMEDALALVEQTQRSIEAIERGAAEVAITTLFEADILAYDSLKNLPCIKKTPRLVYATDTLFRVWNDDIPRLTSLKNKKQTEIITLRGNFLNRETPKVSASILGSDTIFELEVVGGALPNQYSILLSDELIVKLSSTNNSVQNVAINSSIKNCEKDGEWTEQTLLLTILPPIKYVLHASITPKFEEPRIGSRRFTFGETGSSKCNDNYPVGDTYSVGPSPTVLDWRLNITSQNCGSGVTSQVPSGAFGVKVSGKIRGCGRDCFLGVCNCKGRGWLAFNIDIRHKDYFPTSKPTNNFTTSVVQSSYEFSYLNTIPSDNKNLFCDYSVRIKVNEGPNEEIFILTNELPNDGGFRSRVNASSCDVSVDAPDSFLARN
ncbi:hypothetical protein [Glaciecola sp. MF2-115]|uniref:hypothetical protein n=1 Tax=Glaciecola sp. MF2-115 TaxID=3384827 RepID=UPI0039A23B03